MDAGDRVEIVDIEIPIALDLRKREAALDHPFALGDPLHLSSLRPK